MSDHEGASPDGLEEAYLRLCVEDAVGWLQALPAVWKAEREAGRQQQAVRVAMTARRVWEDLHDLGDFWEVRVPWAEDNGEEEER